MSAKKILLVDDESDILDFLSFNLELAEYSVKVASNGHEGVRIAKEFQPDLILLDMMMPEMDGIETCEKIRETEGLKDVVIAFLTARGEDYSQIAGFDAGADDYILKPIKPKVLVSRVKHFLSAVELTRKKEVMPSLKQAESKSTLSTIAFNSKATTLFFLVRNSSFLACFALTQELFTRGRRSWIRFGVQRLL